MLLSFCSCSSCICIQVYSSFISLELPYLSISVSILMFLYYFSDYLVSFELVCQNLIWIAVQTSGKLSILWFLNSLNSFLEIFILFRGMLLLFKTIFLCFNFDGRKSSSTYFCILKSFGWAFVSSFIILVCSFVLWLPINIDITLMIYCSSESEQNVNSYVSWLEI